MTRNFREMLEAQWSAKHFVCVGLDSDPAEIPERWHEGDHLQTMSAFNVQIVDQTCDIAAAYKPNFAFYLAEGPQGLNVLDHTVRFIRKRAPNVPVILDAKWADIGNTNKGYVKYAFDDLRVDAITLHPTLGGEALTPFLKRPDKGFFILCRTSTPGAGEFQNLRLEDGTLLYEHVAQQFSNHWNVLKNCGLVVGATAPTELESVRNLVGDMPLLIPGVGAQGGKVEDVVPVGKDSKRTGFIVNSSRGIIFANDPRGETVKLNDSITTLL